MTAYHADASDLEGKEILTWETFGDAAEELAARIHHSGFDPEILIAVARGGMIPGGASRIPSGSNSPTPSMSSSTPTSRKPSPIPFCWPRCLTPNPSGTSEF
ncbi:xanthine-guanine phosphoribosyltransferase [Cutibacterium acnes JCM 18916]|nr:xanthine-guanine phosphoribosyltransferase [Cutibacterium acnes JCM 18916]